MGWKTKSTWEILKGDREKNAKGKLLEKGGGGIPGASQGKSKSGMYEFRFRKH